MIDVRKVMIFHNGCVAVFDEKGEQVPELQEPWFLDLVKRIEKAGGDPTRVQFEMPNGRTARAFKINTKGGFNWSLR
jgi:hypothetical protein